MDYTIFDIEANDLLDGVTTIHCLSWYKSDGTRGTITNPYHIPIFLAEQKVLVAHNLKRYDNPVILKVIGYEILTRCIDTVALSWYLYPNYKIHGLEEWGEKVGIPKPLISDWKNLSLEEYINRCESDVEINRRIFIQFINKLLLIYGNSSIDEIMDYLTEKLDCAAEQEEVKLKVDLPHCHKMVEELEPLIEEKLKLLEAEMPQVIVYTKATKPKVMYKKDGELSSYGAKWLEKLFSLGLNADHEEPIKIISGYKAPNAGSGAQLKEWLFSLGWKPQIFKYEKIPNSRESRAIPQINDKNGKICKGIKLLYKDYPFLSNIESLGMLRHRLGTFKGFIESTNEDGFMKAEIAGLTNTLRFKHKKPIANLPKVSKPYGKEIRGSIIIPNEFSKFLGSDMNSLEDTTKQHYMYYYDPEYVTTMRSPGFSPHLDIGVQGEMITEDEANFYIWSDAKKENNANVLEIFTPKVLQSYKDMSPEEQDAEYGRIAVIRGDAKQVNFSAVYGIGAPKMSLGTGWPIEKSTKMLFIYWQRNKAVKEVAADVSVKVLFRNSELNTHYTGSQLTIMQKYDKDLFNEIQEMWLYNPVSKFYYSLRYVKDIFSTLNQGTGVYCFDMQVRNVRKRGIKIGLQYHDEIGFPFLMNNEQGVKNILLTAIQETNDELGLNVPLGISMDFGKTYADCH